MRPILLIDFGSTYTKVTAVDVENAKLLGSAAAYTTVQTDVNDGLANAVTRLEEQTGKLDFAERYACSSAAGGLRMIASGLVPELTAEAAKCASLGAGAKVVKTYSFELTEDDAAEILAAKPDIFLLVGGTDGGNKACILNNAHVLAEAGGSFPIVIAGNRNAARECERILAGREVYVCENVMPKFGTLNIEPAQQRIRDIFLNRIVRAKGLTKASELISGILMPTPSAFLAAMRLLADGTKAQSGIGELIAVDVGGATTDVHSVTKGSDEIAVMQTTPEPFAKRTVEGDLGLFVNAKNLVDMLGSDKLSAELGINTAEVMSRYCPIPNTPEQFKLTERLCLAAGLTAIERHAGALRYIYTPRGRQTIAEGKDLSTLKYLVGTGGALTRLPNREQIMRKLADCNSGGMMLYPKPGRLKLLYDNHYIMASLGVLSKEYPDAALNLLKQSIDESNL